MHTDVHPAQLALCLRTTNNICGKAEAEDSVHLMKLCM